MTRFNLSLGLLLLVTAPAVAQPAPPSACAAAERRALDFWVGRWALEDERTGAGVGTSRIERLWDGCAILEDFTAVDGFRGGSLSQWDPQTKAWRLTGGGSTGAAMVFEGAADGARVVLNTRVRDSNGEPRIIRMILEPMADGTVRQASDISSDGGATWRPRYGYIYRRTD